MTDNRTNEPTPEQVEAAAKGMWDRYGDRGMFQHAAEHMKNAFRKDARAALVAAQGTAPQAAKDIHEPDHGRVYCVRCGGNWPCQPAPLPSSTAPQAESEPKPHTRVVTRSFDSDCALGICMSGCSHLMWVCDSCSSEGGWGAARGQLKKWAAEHVCPVLPSSGVDEDALAGVIWQEQSDRVRDGYVIHTRETARSTARAVAEWFRSNTSKSA